MGYKRVEDFLGTELDPAGLKLIQEWKVYLDKTVYFGGELFCELLKKSNLSSTSLPIIMFFRNSVELVDSISSLLINFYSEPARIILRTLLETFLYLDYITEKETSRRAVSFLFCHYREKLSSYNKLFPNSQQNKQLLVELKDDIYLKELKIGDVKLLQTQISNLNNLLNSNFYKEVSQEYTRTKNKKDGRKPAWYELFNGPSTIRDLAYDLKKGSLYEVIYRGLSKGTHGVSIIDGFISKGGVKGITNFKQIRFPYSAQFVCQNTLTLALNIYKNIVKNQLPNFDNKYKKFYRTELREFYLTITSKELLTIK